ncbi:hypothetical protein LTR08_003242 [Meristemomyces frigidus]|nr:hypothetical protein LTR08_003242 [Meristemomyces frigidus]
MAQDTPSPAKHQLDQFLRELLLAIAELLPSNDLLSYRLTCRAFDSAGKWVLLHSDTPSRIYLHPSSINRFIDICGNKDFASKISNIIVVGR